MVKCHTGELQLSTVGNKFVLVSMAMLLLLFLVCQVAVSSGPLIHIKLF